MKARPQFRSTAAYATRERRVVPSVERATFVLFSLGATRYAVPVERIERVLRLPSQPDVRAERLATVAHGGCDVPLVDLAAALGIHVGSSRSSRALIVNVTGGWIAVSVDAVHDVATIDAAIITDPRNSGHDAMTDAYRASAGARGVFVHRELEYTVLDVGRALDYDLPSSHS